MDRVDGELKFAETLIQNKMDKATKLGLFAAFLGITIAFLSLLRDVFGYEVETVDKTEYIKDATALEQKRKQIEIERARQMQKEKYLQEREIKIMKLGGITMQQVDTVLVDTNNNNSYSVNVAMKEGQVFNDLRTLLQIKVNSIDAIKKDLNIQIANYEQLVKEGKLLVLENGKELYFLEGGKKFYINFTNFQNSKGTSIVNLNINQLL